MNLKNAISINDIKKKYSCNVISVEKKSSKNK